MAADAGAQQIYDLLNQSSRRLYIDAIAFSKASRKAFASPYGVMPQYGVDALADMRVFVREVRGEVAAIETADTKAKADALKALDGMDRQFDAYESGLELGFSAQALPKMKKSRKVGKTASGNLRRAMKGLSG